MQIRLYYIYTIYTWLYGLHVQIIIIIIILPLLLAIRLIILTTTEIAAFEGIRILESREIFAGIRDAGLWNVQKSKSLMC